MTIASEITRINGNIAAAYTACNNKGATIPATQNSANLATCIGTISTGGGSSKYGANINTLLGDIDGSGVLQNPTEQSDLVFTGVEDIESYALTYKFAYSGVKTVSFPALTAISGSNSCYYAFVNCVELTSVSMPELTTVSNSSGCQYMFNSCTSLTSISLAKLTTVSGASGCGYMFNSCTSLTSISLAKLTTVSGASGCYYMFGSCTGLTNMSFPELKTVSASMGIGYLFANCTGLTTVSFSKLDDVSGANSLTNAFRGCRALTDVYFNALKTTSFGSNVNQFNNLLALSGNTTVHTLHFPSNLSSTIAGLTGYPNFGGTSGYVSLAFDLTATS